jgi:dTDP-4-amino-4,6-dideoxygalactose transaminase
MFSFHATKLFHTGEGGAIACGDRVLCHRINRLKNFGIADQETVECVGINGKMSELQAALGLAVLDHMEIETARRRAILAIYDERLRSLPGITLTPNLPGVESSCQYCAIRIDPREFGASRDQVHQTLKSFNVFARKYFYPLCSEYPSYRDQPSASAACLPVAQAAASQVLCLPLYGSLDHDAAHAICDIVQSLQAART